MAGLKSLFRIAEIQLCVSLFAFILIYLLLYFFFGRSSVEKVTFEPWTRCMNESADPCLNFYEFACGNYLGGKHKANHSSIRRQALAEEMAPFIWKCLNDTVLHDDATKSAAVQKMRFYRDVYLNSTFDDYKILPAQLLKEVKSFGGCPILDQQWSSDNFNLTSTLLNLTKLAGRMPLFHMFTKPTPDSQMSLFIGANAKKPQIAYENIFDENGEVNFEAEKAFQELNFKILSFVLEESGSILNQTELEQASNETTHIQFSLFKLWRTHDAYKKPEIEHDQYGNYLQKINMPWTKVNFENAMKLFPVLDRRYFIDSPHVTAELRRRLLQNPYIYIERKDLIKSLNDYFSSLSPELTANYLCTEYVSSQIYYTDFNEMERLSNKTLEVLELNKEKKDIDKLAIIRKQFPLVADYLFIEKCVDPKALEDVEDIAEYIKQSTQKIIEQNDWLDDETRNHALFKLKSMKFCIGGVDVAKDHKLLDEYYEKLNFVHGDNLRDLYLKMTLFRAQQFLETFIRPDQFLVDIAKRASHYTPLYYVELNVVYISAASILSPLYDLKHPTVVRYGVVGEMIGHEVFHAFDCGGIHFNAQGNTKQWIHWKTLQVYQNRTQCLVDQYSQIRDSEFALKHLNGSKMLKENMADNDGIRTTYYAWKEKEKSAGKECTASFGTYTNDQLFFISQALIMCSSRSYSYEQLFFETNTHSPDEHRVNEPLKNMPEFASTFKCSIGSAMNPEKKCRVW